MRCLLDTVNFQRVAMPKAVRKTQNQRSRGPEAQWPRGPARLTQRPRDPETQRPRDPETQRPRDPETQRPRDPETQRPRDQKTQSQRSRGPEAQSCLVVTCSSSQESSLKWTVYSKTQNSKGPLTISCNTIQYNTIQYNTIQYNTIQYNTIQYNTIQYNTIRFIVQFICAGIAIALFKFPTFLKRTKRLSTVVTLLHRSWSCWHGV